MKKEIFARLTIVLLLLLAMPAARADVVDSLWQAVASTTGDAKTAAFKELKKAMVGNVDADTLMAMLEQWIAHERQKGDVNMESLVRWDKIAMLSNFGCDDALLAEAPIQMAWFEAHNEWERYYSTWETKACVYLYTLKLQTALSESEKMLKDAQERHNDYGRVVSHQLTGIIYQSMGLNDTAIENLKKALELLKSIKLESNTMLFSVYDYLSQTQGENRDYNGELESTDAWLKAIDDQRRRDGDHPTSLSGTSLSCYVQRTEAFMGLGQLEAAEQELAKATQFLAQINIPLTRYRILFMRARLFLAEEKPIETIACIDSLKTLDMEVGGSVEVLKADALMMLKRYSEAAGIYRQKYMELDSVFDRDMRTQLDELATLYKLDEKEMKSKMERKNMLILIGVVFLAALLIVIYVILRSRWRMAQKNRQLEEANKQLLQANERVEKSAKMKLDFIKSISHEIRTPLNILSGFTQVITNPNIDLPKEELADIHKRINENTDRIIQLVNRMLELSDANSKTVIMREDSVSARDIVADAIRMTNLTSTAEVAFSWDDGPLADTLLKTHSKYASQTLACLLGNAGKFTKKGMIALRLIKKGSFLLFAVEDTGIGVPPEQSEHIFEEFVQLNQYTEGAGIGLSVARSIIRRLGGDVILDTSYTAGARFVMSLPLNPP